MASAAQPNQDLIIARLSQEFLTDAQERIGAIETWCARSPP